MKDVTKILALIEGCDDPEKLRVWITNARRIGELSVEDAAFRRLIAVLPKEKPGTVEHDFWQTIFAFEYALTDERGRTTRLARTRQKAARVGEIQTLKDWALRTTNTAGFTMLLDRKKPELTGEAIVLRHADSFEAEVVAAARRRLEGANVDISSLPGAMQ